METFAGFLFLELHCRFLIFAFGNCPDRLLSVVSAIIFEIGQIEIR